MEGLVLATGGGAVIDPQNRSVLGGRGFVVYLYTSVEQQLARTKKGRERPLLENGDRKEILDQLMAERESMYRDIADLVVETDGRKVKAVANEILERL
jgi:shikimate kinase